MGSSALGAEHRLIRDRAAASASLHRALEILLPLWQANPRKLTLLRDLANCYEELGNPASSQSDWNEARSWYAKSKELWDTWPAIAASSSYDLTQDQRVTRLLDHAVWSAKRLGPSRRGERVKMLHLASRHILP